MEIIKNNKVIVRKEDASKKVFKGVSLDSLAVGEKSMAAKMYYVKGNFASTHQHPHEQCGYVISGKYRLNMEMPEKNIEVLLHAGDSYAIPDNTPRSFEVMGSGEVVDVFTPPSEDYLLTAAFGAEETSYQPNKTNERMSPPLLLHSERIIRQHTARRPIYCLCFSTN